MVEGVARSLTGPLAELDDLVQEGLINVWDRLRRGQLPKTEYVRMRMLNWIRYIERLDRGDSIPYEQAMERSQDWLLAY